MRGSKEGRGRGRRHAGWLGRGKPPDCLRREPRAPEIPSSVSCGASGQKARRHTTQQAVSAIRQGGPASFPSSVREMRSVSRHASCRHRTDGESAGRRPKCPTLRLARARNGGNAGPLQSQREATLALSLSPLPRTRPASLASTTTDRLPLLLLSLSPATLAPAFGIARTPASSALLAFAQQAPSAGGPHMSPRSPPPTPDATTPLLLSPSHSPDKDAGRSAHRASRPRTSLGGLIWAIGEHWAGLSEYVVGVVMLLLVVSLWTTSSFITSVRLQTLAALCCGCC